MIYILSLLWVVLFLWLSSWYIYHLFLRRALNLCQFHILLLCWMHVSSLWNFGGVFQSLMYRKLSSANKCTLTSFPTWIFTFLFTGHIALAMISSNYWTLGLAVSILVWYLSENSFNFSLFRKMLAVGLMYIECIRLIYVLSITIFLGILSWKVVRLFKELSLHIWKWSCRFCIWLSLFAGLHLLHCIWWKTLCNKIPG